MNNLKTIDDYLEMQSLRGKRTSWLKGEYYRLRRFASYLEENNLRLEDMNLKEAHSYRKFLCECNTLTKRSINNYLSSAKSFYAYLLKMQKVYHNPFCHIDKLKCEERLPRLSLKEKDLCSLLSELKRFYVKDDCIHRNLSRYRTHVIGELMYSTGLRISEVSQLTLSDIDFERGLVYVRDGKCGKSRFTYLNDYAKEVLKLYIDKIRPVLNGSETEQLFPVSYYRIKSMMLKELDIVSKKQGLGHFTSHCFRHSLGYQLLRRGCDIRYIQEILGHTNIGNTEIYTKVDKESLKDSVLSCHPRELREAVS
jgi:integrase/recombinase XerC